MAYTYSPEVQGYLNSISQNRYGYDPAQFGAAQYAQGLYQHDQRQAIEWANQQRMSDPAYWAQAFGFGSSSSPSASAPNRYEARLNALLDNPDSIANTGAYKFAFNQGQEAVNRNLAAKGLLKSGNRLAELTKFGQGLASQQYGAEADRLSRLYGIGAQMDIEREKAQNQMKLAQMGMAMDWMSNYKPKPTIYGFGGGGGGGGRGSGGSQNRSNDTIINGVNYGDRSSYANPLGMWLQLDNSYDPGTRMATFRNELTGQTRVANPDEIRWG